MMDLFLHLIHFCASCASDNNALPPAAGLIGGAAGAAGGLGGMGGGAGSGGAGGGGNGAGSSGTGGGVGGNAGDRLAAPAIRRKNGEKEFVWYLYCKPAKAKPTPV